MPERTMTQEESSTRKSIPWSSPHGTPLPPVGDRTLVMGILNVTPDSFSDGGTWFDAGAAVRQARQLVKEGADVIDVGGESTRPNAAPVSADEEIARIVPVIRQLRRELPTVPISIDTYKAEVAAVAIEAGADMINDVWGFKHGLDDDALRRWSDAAAASSFLPPSPMATVAAEKNCPAFLMHNRRERVYADFWPEILADLRTSISLALAAGMPKHQIWIDPGFGFGKKPQHNLEALKHLDRFTALGHPILLGTSRKSTIGLVLDRPVDQRLEGSAATVVWGIAKGCAMVRVHDVAATLPFIQMADAIRKGLAFSPEHGG